MRRSLLIFAASLAGLGFAPLSFVVGQSSSRIAAIGRIDAFASTFDVRRGIRNNAQPLGELDAVVGLERNGLAISMGAWGAFEPKETLTEPRVDLRAGSAGLTDASAWLQLARRRGTVSLSAGTIREWYRRVGSDPAVTELYGIARLDEGPWSPSLSLWQAVTGAHGLYLEPSVGWHPLRRPFAGRVADVVTTLKAGFQVGRRRPDGGAKVPGPSKTGLTYASLAASLREGFWLTGSLAFVALAGLDLQYRRDPALRVSRDGTEGCRLRLWPLVQVGLSYRLGRHE